MNQHLRNRRLHIVCTVKNNPNPLLTRAVGVPEFNKKNPVSCDPFNSLVGAILSELSHCRKERSGRLLERKLYNLHSLNVG